MPRKATPTEEARPHEIDGVPTGEGLAVMGPKYARRVTGGYRITDAGYALIREAEAKNVAAAKARGDDIWTRPPSSGKEVPPR